VQLDIVFIVYKGDQTVHKVDELAYVGINASDVDAWSAYATEVLGMEVAPDSNPDNLYLRMDDNHHRLIVHPKGEAAEDVAYVGWQVRNPAAMAAVAARAEAAGVTVTEGTPEEAAVRRVLGFVHFIDPHSGVRMEISFGPEITFIPHFRPGRAVSGFLTGKGGLGHFVTYVPDVTAAENFYGEVLGFDVSDSPSFPGIGKVAAFMYCNPRHHSLAFFWNPTPVRKANHVMLEYTSLDDVGTAYDICRERDIVKVELGRHNNDKMVSFYTTNPSGWYIELGWGAHEVDPETFAIEHYTVGTGSGMGEWGHRDLGGLI
jgi:2,3-dihydroxybiphenyl 1,2-dioxygenase